MLSELVQRARIAGVRCLPWQQRSGRIAPTKAGMTRRALSARPSGASPAGATSEGKSPNDLGSRKKVTLHHLQQMHRRKERIAMLTAHDFNSAVHADRAGVDMILVGDSLGMVALGLNGTEAVTMDHMIEACKSVHRGIKSAFIVGDMPFGSYQISTEDAVRNAFRLVKEGGAEAIKLEGGEEMAPTVRRIVDSGIIVVGHIGLTPQSQAALGGFRVQGKTADKAAQLLNSALALQKAGCSFLVIEAVPSVVASLISQHLTIPTIGIGCGGSCSGQVLVQMDMLGATIGHTPKFCRKYADLHDVIQSAITNYVADVKAGSFPAEEHTYAMATGEEEKLAKVVPPK